MENRRPPHAKSHGRFADRTRGNTAFKGGSDGGVRGKRKPTRSLDNRTDRRTDGPPDPQRRGDGRYRSKGDGRSHGDGRSYGDGRHHGERDNNRFGYRQDRTRGRNPAGAKKAPYEPLARLTSDAQITDGKFRGRTLQNSVSPHSSHTSRKVREIAFKILARRIKACRILDLGAASGTFGIEAISRGAMLATFVERSARMCSYIRKNLEELGIKNGHGEVIEMEIMPYLLRNSRRRWTWDIVYLDLPDGDAHAAIVDYLSRGLTIRSSGLLIIQHTSSTSYPEKMSQLNRWRTVEQGGTILSIYERI